jgi:hypothetical protein
MREALAKAAFVDLVQEMGTSHLEKGLSRRSPQRQSGKR